MNDFKKHEFWIREFSKYFLFFFLQRSSFGRKLWIILAEHYLAEISKNWRQRSSYSEFEWSEQMYERWATFLKTFQNNSNIVYVYIYIDGFCHHLSLLKRRKKKSQNIFWLILFTAGKIKKKSCFCLQLIK